jgi:hypothetical protein
MSLSEEKRNTVGSWLNEGSDDTRNAYRDFNQNFTNYRNRAADLWSGAQGWGMGEIKGLYEGLAAGGGGGGGMPGYGGELDESKNWWNQVADTGWRTPEQKEAGWGWGNFKNFAETGGWSDPEKADFRARAASGTPQLYEGVRNEMQRGRNVQGGYGPGYTSSLAALARDKQSAIANTQLGAETNLAESIRSGKKWGSEQGAGAAKGELGQMEQGRGEVDRIQREIMDRNNAAASYNAGAGQRDMAMRLGLIDKYTDLARQTGGETTYGQLQLGGLAGRSGADIGYSNAYTQSQQTKDFWDKAAITADVLAGVGSIGLTSFTGGVL